MKWITSVNINRDVDLFRWFVSNALSAIQTCDFTTGIRNSSERIFFFTYADPIFVVCEAATFEIELDLVDKDGYIAIIFLLIFLHSITKSFMNIVMHANLKKRKEKMKKSWNFVYIQLQISFHFDVFFRRKFKITILIRILHSQKNREFVYVQVTQCRAHFILTGFFRRKFNIDIFVRILHSQKIVKKIAKLCLHF